MNERMLADIVIFLLTWIVNMILLETVIASLGLGWQILILCIVDSIIWWTADYLEFFEEYRNRNL